MVNRMGDCHVRSRRGSRRPCRLVWGYSSVGGSPGVGSRVGSSPGPWVVIGLDFEIRQRSRRGGGGEGEFFEYG